MFDISDYVFNPRTILIQQKITLETSRQSLQISVANVFR